MERTLLEDLTEEVELARQGKIKYEPDPPFVVIDDPERTAKGIMRIRRLNGEFKNGLSRNGRTYKDELKALILELSTDDVIDETPKSEPKPRTGSAVRVSNSTYSSLTRKAKKSKVRVSKLVEKLIAK